MLSLLLTEGEKSKKLKLAHISLSIASVIAVLSTFSIITGSLNSEDLANSYIWKSVMISLGFFSALVWPIFTSIIASKQVENEFENKGWFLMSMAGVSFSKILFMKATVAAYYIGLCNVLQVVLTIAIGKVFGAKAPVGVEWLYYVIGLQIVGIVFYGYSVLVGLYFKNQFFTVIFGIANSFIAAFFILVKVPFNYLFPWAYFALVSPVRMENQSLHLQDISWIKIIAFSLISVVVICLASAKAVYEK